MERRHWTAQEDKILKDLYEKVQVNKWSIIARKMQLEYGLPPRTGKQCRQRYNNHLNPLVAKQGWTPEEEEKLLRLHDEMGNKWAVIGSQLGGRTDNGVKNHFFAKLRRAMRRINRLIKEDFRKDLKEIKLNVLYKIVQANEQKFKKEPLCILEVSQFSCSLKNKILAFSDESYNIVQKDDFKDLIREIHQFGKTYKRKPKILRRIPNQKLSVDPQESDEEQIEEAEDREESSDMIIRPNKQLPASSSVIGQDQKREVPSETMKVALCELDEEQGGYAHNLLRQIMPPDDEKADFFRSDGRCKFYTPIISQQRFNVVEDSGIQCYFPFDSQFCLPPKKQFGDESFSQQQQQQK